MQARKWFYLGASVVVFAVLAMAQQQSQKEIKHVPIKQTNASSGREMYGSYCAVCHGNDGRGNGPAASELKVVPTDLSKLAFNNKGEYPALHVSSVLRGEAETPAHGSKDMPVWGPLFRHISQGHDAEVQQRIANLNNYLESMQQK
jgi:mono/diheme cytochrome c family protein